MANETVTLKLPSGESVDFMVPGGMSDAEVKTFVLSKRPDLFQSQSPAPQNPPGTPDAMFQARQGIRNIIPNPAPTPSSIVPAQGGGAHLLQAPNPGAGPAMPDPRAQQFQEGQEAGFKQAGTDAALAFGTAGLGSIIPSAAKAGKAFQAVSEAAGKVPIEVGEPGAIALRAKELQSAGGRLPKVIGDFLQRATDPVKGPITFDEARDFYQNASRISSEEAQRLTGPMHRQVAQFTSALGNAIEQAAGKVGMADTFSGAMRQYHNAKVATEGIQWTRDAMLELIKKAAGPGAVGYGVGKAISGGKK